MSPSIAFFRSAASLHAETLGFLRLSEPTPI